MNYANRICLKQRGVLDFFSHLESTSSPVEGFR